MERKRKPTVFVRVLELSDPHGGVWAIKMVYNKRKNTYTLTEGWKEYVQSKRLVAGDTVVLMKYALSERLLIGTRRGKERGNLNPDIVKEGMESAAKYEKFVVQFYPNAGRSFLVEQRIVESVLNRVLHPGMRVQMALDVDASRVRWFKGQLYCIKINDTWQGTLWRIFKVKWDKPEEMKNFEWVSPWQIMVDHSHCHAHD